MSDAWRWIDCVGAATVAYFAFVGFQRGLAWQLVRFLGIVAAACVARALGAPIADRVGARFAQLDERAAYGLAWCATMAFALALVAFALRCARDEELSPKLAWIDRVGGVLAGALAAVALHAALVIAVASLGSREWSSACLRGTRSERLMTGLDRRWPMFIDERAARTLAPMAIDP